MPSLDILECERMIEDIYRSTNFMEVRSGQPIDVNNPILSNRGPAAPTVSRSGTVLGYDITTAAPSASSGTIVNSNTSGGTYGSGSRNFNLNVGGTRTDGQITRYAGGSTRISTGATVRTVAGKLSAGATAVAVGAALGAKIDSALYNIGKFFDLNPPESLNPETWDTIATSEGGKSLIRHLFDIDGDSGTLYAPKEVIDYMYDYWYRQGMWNTADPTADYEGSTAGFPYPNITSLPLSSGLVTESDARRIIEFNPAAKTVLFQNGDNVTGIIISESPLDWSLQSTNMSTGASTQIQASNFSSRTVNGTPFYYTYTYTISASTIVSIAGSTFTPSIVNEVTQVGTIVIDGTVHTNPTIPGISPEPGQTLVDPAQVPTGGSVVDAYPNIFNNPISENVPQPDGSTKTIVYYPIPLPRDFTTDTPTTGTNTQTDPEITDTTSPEKEIKDLIDWLTDVIPSIPDGPTNPTPNVPDTGSGSTPPVTDPTGEASSMWTIYNPTQAQLDAFGGWLWSSNFVEQLKKLFNDPMQAIIGVHKVFATPSTGSQVNIVCGYIDSGCPAAEVTDQYTTIDCGTVNVREYYGNVFDYSPFTKISLYLPFIGIVDLDVADVMRGSVNVKYHVDVITGACLADVKINRDGESAILYQYAGSAIVTYPVSSGSYASAVTGVLSLAAGVAGTVMTGGAAAPALIGGAVGLSHIHANVQHSGGFAGAPGAMGGKKPYLIISRAQDNNASEFQHYEGKPANKTVKLGDCDGFVKVKSINIDAVPATYGELDQIVVLLKTGVII